MGVYLRHVELTGSLFGFCSSAAKPRAYSLYREYGESISSFSGSELSFHKKLIFSCKQGCFLACFLVHGESWKMRSEFTQTSPKSERDETGF